MNFKDYNLQPFLMEALEELSFMQPTEIQERIIPLVLAGKSVVGQSQTGSGKSHSFLLPLINKLNPAKEEVQIVITSPSRELAEQLYQAASQLVAHAPEEIRVSTFVGGTDKQRQMNKLQNQQPHVVIGTPGRILDLITEKALKVHTASVFVVDEADMTLDMGFLHDVDQIAGTLPKRLQMLVFSATIPNKLQPFLKKYMENPEMVHLQPKMRVAPTIENYLLSTKSKGKEEVLKELLTMGQPYFAMVFANTKQKVDEIAAELRESGIDCAVIHGDVPARERKRIMRRVHNMEFQFLVATDLAARGIDIEGVSHVINYEVPADLDFFIHRIGRTGRKNMKGTAITLYSPDEEKVILDLEKAGIEFQLIELKNGQIVEVVDRRKRPKRESVPKEEYDARIKGMVNKAKKKVKPGYKRKLKQQIKTQQRKNTPAFKNKGNKKG